ncbi:flagellar motor protein MotB [Novosphingobium colocasiae]|uniref:Chemotaxis protein MotB n=1 Tax=Novosphingobium colocasiae TaxID=1256513 RepID=A0A918PD45_9SPHN|nr:flagellar motor protein MotB [Novosphingobium colocasiae]GGZ00331.1 chemotaxis protein MotB [Novosphingobium colocasiae]
MASKGNETRPIVIRKVKKVVGGGHHGGAWKVAYADFVTAMMAFFMLLWLMANPDKILLKGLAEYFSADTTRESPITTLTTRPGSQPGDGGHGRNNQSESRDVQGQPAIEAGVAGVARGGTSDVPAAALRVMAQEMQVALEPPADTPGQPNVDVRPSPEGMRIHLVDNAQRSMFRGSTAQLNDFARGLLARAAKKLAGMDTRIAIEGHTDGAGGGDSAANWKLSSERALAAQAAMVAAGLPADRFAEVVGKAGTEPVYPDQPERPENRRITIVVMAESGALPSDASFKF